MARGGVEPPTFRFSGGRPRCVDSQPRRPAAPCAGRAGRSLSITSARLAEMRRSAKPEEPDIAQNVSRAGDWLQFRLQSAAFAHGRQGVDHVLTDRARAGGTG